MGANCLPAQSLPLKAPRVAHVGASRSKIGARSGKSKPFRVPRAKIVQVQALLMQGRSQRKIGRMLHVSPMTVARISTAEDFQTAIREAQEKIFSNLSAIADTLIAGAIADPYLGYQLLKDFGVIPGNAARFLDSLKKINPTPEQIRAERVIRHIADAMSEHHRQFEVGKRDDFQGEVGAEVGGRSADEINSCSESSPLEIV